MQLLVLQPKARILAVRRVSVSELYQCCGAWCRDGSGTDALLQHPLGVLAMRNGSVLVADSYNHKLKARFEAFGCLNNASALL